MNERGMNFSKKNSVLIIFNILLTKQPTDRSSSTLLRNLPKLINFQMKTLDWDCEFVWLKWWPQYFFLNKRAGDHAYFIDKEEFYNWLTGGVQKKMMASIVHLCPINDIVQNFGPFYTIKNLTIDEQKNIAQMVNMFSETRKHFKLTFLRVAWYIDEP